MDTPVVLALDFDGVLCDGRREYFETAWRAYARVWPRPLTTSRPAALAGAFAQLRPLVESGWEMPVLVHALLASPDGLAVARRAWSATARALLAEAGLTAETVGRALNAVRDDWFATDRPGWLAQHAFYPGVVERLLSLEGTRPVVVTTKAARFARALLAARDPRLADTPVIGREPDRPVPKPDILLALAAEFGLGGGAGLWFVEDLLDTLEAAAARPGLERARLFLAAWGYNFLEDRARAGSDRRVGVLSLTRFAAPLSTWPRRAAGTALA